MKTRIKLLLSAALALPLVGLGPIITYANENAASPTTTAATTDTTVKQNRDKRVKEHKDKLKVKLSNLEQKRLQERCKNAQGKVSSLQGRITGVETSHNKVYGNLLSRLTTLSDKLKAQGVDTTQLDAQITELTTQVTKFKTDLATYKTDVSDLAALDCAADPSGFKATLEASRIELALLRQESTAIRSYVQNTIKPTLQTIRAALVAKKTTGGAQ